MRAAVHRHMCLCVVSLALGSRSLAAPPVQARQLPTPDDASPAEERESRSKIVITGSRIPRTNLTAVSPVTLIGSEEFKLQGATNVEEVLNQLPQINPSQGEFVSAGATGAATIDLRGLGSVRTLVLVNGHRLMPGDPRFPVPDVNSIPTSIVQRVEVLTGGAAAVYGSDAVAGVVNFILDTKFNGFKVEGEISGYQHDNRDRFVQGLLDQRQIPYPNGSVFDGRRRHASVAFGRSVFDDRAHITIYGGYRQIDGLTQDRRDYSSCAITAQTVGNRRASTLECGGALLSYPGNFFDNLGHVYQVTADRTFTPGLSRYNYAPWNFYQRPDKRYTAGGFANFELSSAVQPYAELMYMSDRSVAQTSPSGDATNTETINCDNPLLSDQQRSLICKAGNFVGEELLGPPTPFVDSVTGATYSRAWLSIARRNVEGGPVQDDLRHKSVRLLTGSKGDLGRGVTYDASYLFGRVTLDWESRNNLSIRRLTRALDVVSDPSTGQPICRSALIAAVLGPSSPGADSNCMPWDVFAIGQVTPQSVAYLSIPPSMRGSFRQRVGNLNATVELARWGVRSPWSDDSPAINVGAEFRKDLVDFDPDEFSQTGDVAGFAPHVFSVRGSITSKEIFGEARFPLVSDRLVRALAFEGGFRKSWYANPESKFSSNAYKVALDLTPVTGMRVRASLQGAIRAPNILELFAPAQPDAFERDPCAGNSPTATVMQCALTGVTAAQYGHLLPINASLFGYNAILGGNVDLQPETATTRTIGVVLEPRFLRGFNATIDWWDIKLNDAIARIGAQAIVDGCVGGGDPILCSRIHRASSGSLWLGSGYVDDRQANLGGVRVGGVDVGSDYSLPLNRLGSANVRFRGSYILRWNVDNGGLSVPYDCAGLFGDPCDMHPRWRHTARLTWNAPAGISMSLNWRHVGGVRVAALDPKFDETEFVSPANTSLQAQNYFDVTAAFRLRNRFELRLGVNNMFDQQPPLVIRNTAAATGLVNGNTYPEWYDALGRFIFGSLSATFKP